MVNMKCYMNNCINNNEWACMYRSDCNDCSKDCKYYYKCDSCDYYLSENMKDNERKYYAGMDMTNWDLSYNEDDPKFIYKAFIALCNYAEEFDCCNTRCPLYELCFSKNGEDGQKFWNIVYHQLDEISL